MTSLGLRLMTNQNSARGMENIIKREPHSVAYRWWSIETRKIRISQIVIKDSGYELQYFWIVAFIFNSYEGIRQANNGQQSNLSCCLPTKDREWTSRDVIQFFPLTSMSILVYPCKYPYSSIHADSFWWVVIFKFQAAMLR